MKVTKNQIISSGITILTLSFGVYYIYKIQGVDLNTYHNQMQTQQNADQGHPGDIAMGEAGGEMPFDMNTPLKDERFQITDQKDSNYNSSVMLNTIANEQMFGTSYVAGKNTVVTNRHVVHGFENKPEALEARVGHLDKNGKFEYTTFKVKKIFTPAKEEIDVAVLQIEPLADGTQVGDLRTPVTFGDASKLAVGQKISIVGYPGDKPFGSLWDSRGTVAGTDFPLFLKALTKEGNSGSPVFNEQGEVVAMLNAGGDAMSFGFPMTEEILDFIKKHTK